jgi:hypothetical protein
MEGSDDEEKWKDDQELSTRWNKERRATSVMLISPPAKIMKK